MHPRPRIRPPEGQRRRENHLLPLPIRAQPCLDVYVGVLSVCMLGAYDVQLWPKIAKLARMPARLVAADVHLAAFAMERRPLIRRLQHGGLPVAGDGRWRPFAANK